MASNDLMPTIDTFVSRLQEEGYPVQVILESLKEYTEIYEELSSKWTMKRPNLLRTKPVLAVLVLMHLLFIAMATNIVSVAGIQAFLMKRLIRNNLPQITPSAIPELPTKESLPDLPLEI